jgi:3-isopropylmalate/(R)-2-methylmalate dehydratase small subunit
LLPVQVTDEFLTKIWAQLEADPHSTIEVNLEKQKVILADGTSEGFDINPYKKACLLNGYDDIDYLLSLKDHITAFETAK